MAQKSSVYYEPLRHGLVVMAGFAKAAGPAAPSDLGMIS